MTLIQTGSIQADTISGWRNDGTGYYPEAEPVINWSASESVIWKTPLPDWGNCMPVLVDDKIFLNVEPDILVCLSASDGQILWQRSSSLEDAIASLNSEETQASEFTLPKTQTANGYTSPTPISDGQHVYIVYGTGVVAAYDLDGNRLWIKLYEQPTDQWGHSTSPRLVDNKLIVHIISVMALDPNSGDVIWKTDSTEAWGTSAVADIGGIKIIATSLGDIIRVSDGAKLASGLYSLPFSSPIIQDGVIYGADQEGGFAIKLPETIDGDKISTEVLWENNPPSDRYYSSPILVDNILYTINRGQQISAIDAITGDILYTQRIEYDRGNQLYGSFSFVADHLFVGHDNGQIAVLKPGREYQIVTINTLEASRSTPVFDGSRILLRTEQNLYNIGN